MRRLVPIRLGIIKRYFDKYKFQKNKRQEILEAIEESEQQLEEILGEEHVPFAKACPEVG